MRDSNQQKAFLPDWVKWSSLIIILLAILLLILGIYLYREMIDNKSNGFSDAENRALQETKLTDVEKVERFHGKESYYIVFGNDESNNKLVVFVPIKNREKELLQLQEDEIISETTIIENWKSDCSSCELIKVVPGVVDEKALWELTYKDHKDNYFIEYRSIYDGKQLELLRLKNKFE
ncbi:cell wall elongation regulator TseB-like domain-containing protein [Ornithinibacillus halophilus]|uniref:Uncharacterized protein YpmB n=1 Tax=Ornithinibacillus halophilus TaxID=930117 RepID=A0A1M5CN24_9BACI|nr:DUF5590 domain-containing protein [Ornithinibacillus halophilus]SHF56121.1 Uncharacterized protein YpmB [Ornithinibacillus halophilus]